MARDRANIRTDIWADSHWRSLSYGAQWLYQFILQSPSLNLCGVADWRPAKWSGMAVDVSKKKIEEWATELEREFFIVIDRDTEEVVIRSFFRHDGILSQPNPMRGAVREFAGIGSELIRGVISHELARLQEEFPKGLGKANVWDSVSDLRTVLKTPPIDIRNPSVNPSGNPSGNGSYTSTSTSTTSKEVSGGASRGSRVPEPFTITDDMRKWAKQEAPLVDIDRKTIEFVDYWAALPGQRGMKSDWLRTWKNDMRKKQEFAERDRPSKPKVDRDWALKL